MEFKLARKRPSEKLRIGVDFSNELDLGDTVISHVVTAEDQSGVDVSATLLESPNLASNVSSVIVKNGVSGSSYVVAFTGTTGTGQVIEHSILVPVYERA